MLLAELRSIGLFTGHSVPSSVTHVFGNTLYKSEDRFSEWTNWVRQMTKLSEKHVTNVYTGFLGKPVFGF